MQIMLNHEKSDTCTENDLNHFLFVLLIKMWAYLKITECWQCRYMLHTGVLQITQIQQATLNQQRIVANNV